jgi:alpha-mannosidase/mannosylglycerate hydrolase
MADKPSNLDFGTKKLDPNDLVPLIQLYTIPYLRWDREGYETFESRRARLLNTLAKLHEQMRANTDTVQTPLRFLLLGGQTVILEDVAAVHSDLVEILVDYNDKGRLSIGPWYVAVNEALVSDEALVRNLMAARDDARRFRVKLMPVAYFPESFGHVSQLPQILQGFGIDAALISHGLPVVHLPFNWEAPDGSQILVVNDEPRAGWPPPVNDVDDVAASLDAQRAVRPDGPFLWLCEIVDPDMQISPMVKALSEKVDVPVQYSNLLQYTMALRHELPDEMRPMLGGELWMQSLKERAYLFPGTLSSRIYLKQANARLQACMLQLVEPLLAIALTHGQPAYPDNLRNLLDHSWRLLLKNQAANALGGTSIDAVHRENELRFQKVADNAEVLIRDALDALPGTPYQVGRKVNPQNTCVVIWNGHNWPLQQVVEVRLAVPEGKYPAKVTAPDGSEVIFGWQAHDEGSDGVLSLLAKPPGMGYTTYSVEFGDTPPAESHKITTSAGTSISKGNDTVVLEDGMLVWRSGDREIRNLLEFYDGGDAGDTYNYSPPETDLIERPDLISDIKVESSPLYERLVLRHRMRVAVGLNADRTRSRGLRLLELYTTITLYEGMPGVYFQTQFENTARDHRLRAHLRTGMKSDFVHADSAYALMKRLAVAEGPAFPDAGQQHIEGVINTQPVQRVVAVMGEDRTLNLLVSGLPEYEAIEEDDQLTLALTLVRAVGWLSRKDLRTRTAAVAPVVEVPEAQSLREFTAEYALVYTDAGDSAAVLRAGREFNAPLVAQQYIEPPNRLERSYLSVLSNRGTGAHSDGNGVIVTAFKPPVKGSGWIVRLFNPNDQPVEVHLTPHKRSTGAYVMLMSEKPKRALETDSNGSTVVVVGSHEVMTVRFSFEE